MTQAGQEPGASQSELLERLRNLDALQSPGTLSELAYRRAREALEKALDEASKLRLQALEDARATRERELALTMEALKALRQSAEAQVQSVLAQADIEAADMRRKAAAEADATLEEARREAEDIAAEAAAVRQAAEARAREVAQLEAEFNAMVSRFSERIGLGEKPAEGFWRKLFGAPSRK
jgi:colicin import membrane protein